LDIDPIWNQKPSKTSKIPNNRVEKPEVMKSIVTSYAFIGILAAGGFLSAILIPNAVSFGTQSVQTSNVPIQMLGHFTLVATDSQGNVKGYIQTDNEIKNNGENCVAESIFKVDGTANATSSCGGTSAGGLSTFGFRFLSIGTGSSDQEQGSNDIQTALGSRAAASTVTFTESRGDGSNSRAQVLLSKQFTINSTATVTEAGVHDASSGGNMFSRQTFTGISLQSGDKLTVSWTATIGTTTGQTG
jgi:hypothetical protein